MHRIIVSSSLALKMLHVVGLLLGFADPPLRRESLILFSRHGIRVPFSPDPRGIDIFSTNPTANWYTNASDWGAPGEAYLTQHGESVVERMGEYYRERLVSSGLLPSDGSRITAYADADPTGRDVKTAQSFFRGLLPGVGCKTVGGGGYRVGLSRRMPTAGPSCARRSWRTMGRAR